MSVLYLVRHGQASFGKDDYDQLSRLGVEQSRLLGRYWAERKMAFDAVYSGSHKRQLDTADSLRDEYKKAGLSFPETIINSDFNEYDAQSIVTRSLPTVLKEHPHLVELFKNLSVESGLSQPRSKEDFQRLFSKVMEYWVSGKLVIPGMESWSEFTARVNRGLDEMIREQSSGKTVAVFSSGGPISVIMKRALSTDDQITLNLGWVTKNTSFSEFRFSSNRFSLYSYNETPHLTKPDMLSYR